MFRLKLTDLPDLPLDKVISYLEAEDLRSFHQVSREWKAILEKRPKENKRRKQLVKIIRDNQENMPLERIPQQVINSEPPLATAMIAFRTMRNERMSDVDQKKAGVSLVLLNCTNQSISDDSRVSTPNCSSSNFLTPTSRFAFQEFHEAEQSLEPGQKLFQCRKCRGPVPSPVTPNTSRESRRLSRCNLTSKLDPDDKLLDSPRKRGDNKKARTLSAVDLSPIPFPSTSMASLEKMMTQSLVLSSPDLYNPTGKSLSSNYNSDLIGSSTPDVDMKRSTSCSGIDLPPTMDGQRSQLDLRLDFNTSSFDKSASIDLNSSDLNCARSCCRRVDHFHNSQYSDSGLSFGSETTDTNGAFEFKNMVPSPQTPGFSRLDYFSNSLERGRLYQENNDSGGHLSIPSMHLQRSDQNFSVENPILPNEDNLISILECPNPSCKYRFCSNCEECEHPDRSCRDDISSENLESLLESSGRTNYSGRTTSSSKSDRSRESNSKKSKAKHNSKKLSLKRLSKLN